MVPQPNCSLTAPPAEEPNESNVIPNVAGVVGFVGVGVGVVEPPPLQHTSTATKASCTAPESVSHPVKVEEQLQLQPQPRNPPCVATIEPVVVVPEQQKAVSRVEPPISSDTSMAQRTTEGEPVRSSAPQQQHQQQEQQQQQQQQQQQSLSIATTEEQKTAPPKPLATQEEPGGSTSASTTAPPPCAVESTVTQQQQQQQQHQHHSPLFAATTTPEDQQKQLAATAPTHTAAAAASATNSCATQVLGTSASQQQQEQQQQQQPSAQSFAVTTETETETETTRNHPAASIGNSLAASHHVNPPTSETPKNSSGPQQLIDKTEHEPEHEHDEQSQATLIATATAAAGALTILSTTALCASTANPESSVSPQQQQQQQQQHQNETEGTQHESSSPAVVVETEPIRYPEPVRYVINGVGTSTPCHVHRPTLEELKAQSFSDFVRHKVLATASRFLPYSDDDNGDNIADQDKKEAKKKDETSKEEAAATATAVPVPTSAPAPTPTPIPTPTEAAPERTRRKVATPERYRVNKMEEKIPVAKKKPTKRKDDADEEAEEEEWTQGMAKVSLPVGFWSREGIAGDETARGPAWQAGTELGDMTLEQPIQQNIRGLAGTYEYTFTVQPSMPMRAFRDKADAYRKSQVGSEVEPLQDLTAERLTALERLFWRRLGPTMPAAWYGADLEGTLFGDELAMGWSIGNLDSLLHILSRVPGVTSPYLYAGMWASVFCAHTEDMNLLSINYLHAGAPKIWYAVAPGPDAARFEALAEFQYSVASKECKEFLRHKRCLMSPRVLQKAGIRYTTTVQMPGEAVITFPGGYHFGFNTGFNVAEATNFGVAEWLPFGRRARVCLCRPDSVRIDLWRLTALLRQYRKDKKKEPSLSWKQWGQRKEEEDNLAREKAERKRMQGINAVSPAGKSSPNKSKGRGSKKNPKIKPSEQQRKQEFWVEVMRAVTNNQKTTAAAAATTALSKRLKGNAKRKRKQEKIEEPEEDVWHLARPIGRKRLELHTRVLCLVPATVMSSKRSKAKSKADIDDEQCFSGQVVEIADDCARVHLDGTQKSEDTWIYSKSAKLFLDGGRWSEPEEEDSEVPPKHYWKEVDSKRLCVEK